MEYVSWKDAYVHQGRNEWVHSQIGKKYFQYSTSFCANVLKKSEDIPQRWISKGNNCCEWWPLFLKTHLSQENTWIHCIRNISCSWRITRCQSYWLWKLYLLAAVKCPHTKFHVEACSDPNFLMVKISDTRWRLKTDPAYYGQVWGQMDGTGVKWCDFIVYTSKGIYIGQIAFDPVYWGNLKNELLWYYFEHFAKICISRFP